jgi:transcriptional regulator with XRE-family HTH domain
MSVKFGDRVTQARKEKGLSREELAELIGTSAPPSLDGMNGAT